MKPPRPETEEVELDQRLDPDVQKQLIKTEADNARTGRMVGLLVILVGVILTIAGATGAVDLKLSGMGLNAQVVNAAPGIVLALIGLVIVWRTNLKVTAKK
jgi:uncharacterized protein YjeT (DUF2065 family)